MVGPPSALPLLKWPLCSLLNFCSFGYSQNGGPPPAVTIAGMVTLFLIEFSELWLFPQWLTPPLLSFIYKDVSKAGSHSGSSSSSTSFGAFWLEPPVNVSYSRVIDSYSRVIGKSTLRFLPISSTAVDSLHLRTCYASSKR